MAEVLHSAGIERVEYAVRIEPECDVLFRIMNHTQDVLESLREFADAVRATTRATATGDPESQLVAPIQGLLSAVGRVLARCLTIVAEASVRGLGQPDCCVEDQGVLIGYVELKAPGKGADPGSIERSGPRVASTSHDGASKVRSSHAVRLDKKSRVRVRFTFE